MLKSIFLDVVFSEKIICYNLPQSSTPSNYSILDYKSRLHNWAWLTEIVATGAENVKFNGIQFCYGAVIR